VLLLSKARGSILLLLCSVAAGGNVMFEGHNLSLVCYHGINLRSKSWVVFIMQEPGVSFSTEAQEVIDEGA